MLRHCEADLRREIAKAQKLNELAADCTQAPLLTARKILNTDAVQDAPLSGHQDNLLLNKRIEVLRYIETTSAPNSPKSCRFSPRKTHVSNFICQNVSPTDLMRRKSVDQDVIASSKYSPQLQLNGRRMVSPPKSPAPRRRIRSQSPKVPIVSDSDSDSNANLVAPEVNGNKENHRRSSRKSRVKPEKTPTQFLDEADYMNRNIVTATVTTTAVHCSSSYRGVDARRKTPLMSFSSVDMGKKSPAASFYCPQSEPLKRKIYSGSKTLEKLQKSLEMESGNL